MIHRSKGGYFYIMLDVCDCSVLRHLLHPAGHFVWIHSHTPDPALRWWKADVPISPGDILKDVEIRLMEFDLVMTRDRFIENLDQFVPHGMSMTQVTRRVPDSLWVRSLPEENLDRILIENGMKARFYLPHAGELAQFSCVDRAHLEAVCEIPEIRSLLPAPEGEPGEACNAEKPPSDERTP